jgi:hypothetical protein
MKSYIKYSSKVLSGKNLKTPQIKSTNIYTSYNKFIDPKFSINNLFYKDSINYSVGQNLITKPYWTL